MELGYYWAHHIRDSKWRIVEVVKRLPEHVLEGGYAWLREAYSEFEGPLIRDSKSIIAELKAEIEQWQRINAAWALAVQSGIDREAALQAERDDLAAKLAAAQAELHELRIGQ